MKKSELIARVAERSGSSKAEVGRVLEATTAVCIDAVQQGDSVPLGGLGSLRPRLLRPRTIRSIADMRRMRLGRRWTVRFRPSTRLRRALGSLASQDWRQPEHQQAWRLAETLVADLDLYHGKLAPELAPQAGDELVHTACESAFGGLWIRVRDSYCTRIPPHVRSRQDYLADAARQRWAA